MESEVTPVPQNPPFPSHVPRRRRLAFWAAAALVLLLALSVGIAIQPSRRPKLRSLSWSLALSHRILSPGLPHRILTLLSPAPPQGVPPRRRAGRPISARPPCVLWMAPFVSGGGYSSEAWSYITALDRNSREGDSRIRLEIEQHGDLENLEFWEGLPEGDKELALRLHRTACRPAETVVVCHSEPGAWYPPLFQTLPCPPAGYSGLLAVVGRTMFETDRLNAEHVRRCNRMDAVWVPTGFHVRTFVGSGVEPSKVVKVVQPVDVDFFDPSKYEPLVFPAGSPVLGSGADTRRKIFVFLSVFKWGRRKGWDVLLRSYLREFSAGDWVALYLLTNPYHSDKNFENKIARFAAEDAELKEPDGGWAPVYVMDTHIPQVDMPRLYKAADAFVLPSRGEGWGRPLVEAMAMELPVIATNWSGPTEYLTEDNSFPLPISGMGDVTEGPFKEHLWAEPAVDELRALMRRVVSDPEEARRRAGRARDDMVRRFSPAVVAGLVVEELLKVAKTAPVEPPA